MRLLRHLQRRLQAETLFCELHRARDEIETLRARLSRYEDVGDSDAGVAGGSTTGSSGSSSDGRLAAVPVGSGAGHLDQLQRRISAPAIGNRPYNHPQGQVKLELPQAVSWEAVSTSTAMPRSLAPTSMASGLSEASEHTSMGMMPNALGLEPMSQATTAPAPYHLAITSMPTPSLSPDAAANAMLSGLPWPAGYDASAVPQRLLSRRETHTSDPGPSGSGSSSNHDVSSSMTAPPTMARQSLYPEDVFWAAHLMGSTAAVEGTQWASTESLDHRSLYATAAAPRPERDPTPG